MAHFFSGSQYFHLVSIYLPLLNKGHSVVSVLLRLLASLYSSEHVVNVLKDIKIAI